MAKTLLPAGCYDRLPPYAARLTDSVHALLRTFRTFGYAQAQPPLLEYTESLLSGRGTSLAPHIFRVMDPLSNKVMGLCADMTLPIARIASARMRAEPRPLRLAYAGPILRAKGDGFEQRREFTQAGVELIGSHSPEADAEVILVVAEALRNIGLARLSIDLNAPLIVALLLADDALTEEEAEKAFDVLRHKDITALSELKLQHGKTLAPLVASAGNAEASLRAAREHPLPPSVEAPLAHLAALHALLKESLGDFASITIDITEARGLEYHSGIMFTLFAPELDLEIGRGGRYRIEQEEGSEDATGLTLYVDTLLKYLPDETPARRVLVTEGLASEHAVALRAQGVETVQALPGAEDMRAEARRLKCQAILQQGILVELEQ